MRKLMMVAALAVASMAFMASAAAAHVEVHDGPVNTDAESNSSVFSVPALGLLADCHVLIQGVTVDVDGHVDIAGPVVISENGSPDDAGCHALLAEETPWEGQIAETGIGSEEFVLDQFLEVDVIGTSLAFAGIATGSIGGEDPTTITFDNELVTTTPAPAFLDATYTTEDPIHVEHGL